jgi:hypothetical protein
MTIGEFNGGDALPDALLVYDGLKVRTLQEG